MAWQEAAIGHGWLSPGTANTMRNDIKKLHERNAKLRAMLQRHHDWHLSQGEVSAPDGDGGHITWNASDEYGDSTLGEDTAELLHATVSTSVNAGETDDSDKDRASWLAQSDGYGPFLYQPSVSAQEDKT